MGCGAERQLKAGAKARMERRCGLGGESCSAILHGAIATAESEPLCGREVWAGECGMVRYAVAHKPGGASHVVTPDEGL